MRDVFDIRNVIAALLGIFGLILVGVDLTGQSGHNPTKADGSVNLWTGIALLAVSLFFVGWAYLRPVPRPTPSESEHPTD
ncbi:MAG: hypothetical protein ACRDUS_18275 [Mycobacterium sp.]